MEPLLLVEATIRSAASTLSESLHWYWPTTGPNELAERNISLHVAGALQRSGFYVFGEGNSENNSRERLDVLALNPTRQTAVVVECKRLLDAVSAGGMADDVSRILKFRFQQGPDLCHPNLQISQSFGVVVGTTWSREYAEWFLGEESHADPGEGFGRLWQQVPSEALWGASVLQHFQRRGGDRAGQTAMQWLVYAIFKR